MSDVRHNLLVITLMAFHNSSSLVSVLSLHMQTRGSAAVVTIHLGIHTMAASFQVGIHESLRFSDGHHDL